MSDMDLPTAAATIMFWIDNARTPEELELALDLAEQIHKKIKARTMFFAKEIEAAKKRIESAPNAPLS